MVPEKCQTLRKEEAESGGSPDDGDGRAAEGNDNLFGGSALLFQIQPAVEKEMYNDYL
jgi:hypothetical protein